MELFIIVVVILLIVLIIVPVIYRKILISNYLKNLKKYLDSKTLFYKLEKVINHKNTFHLLLEQKNYYFILIPVPSNSQIQINNKVTWELKTGGGRDLGSAPTKKELLTKVVPFMNASFDGKKVVVFLPNIKKAVMYINECEIVLVNNKTNVHGTNICVGNDFEIFKD